MQKSLICVIICLAGSPVMAAETETSTSQRVLHFPKDRSLGRIMIQDVTAETPAEYLFDYWYTQAESLGEAQGDIIIPSGKKAALLINEKALSRKDFSALLNLKPNDLYLLSFIPMDYRKNHLLSNKQMEQIAHLAELKILWISQATTTTENLKYLTKLQSLEMLVPPKGLTNKGLSYVSQLKSLKCLYLVENEINNKALEHFLPRLTNLEELGLYSGSMNNEGLACLVKLSKLHCLSLNSGNFTDEGLSHLQNLTALKKLDLNYLPITDNGIHYLSDLKGLEILKLHNTGITDRGLAYLKPMSSLKELDVGKISNMANGKPQITDAGMVHIAELKNLEKLTLPGGITDQGTAHIAKLKKLKYLWGGGNNDTALEYLSKLQFLEYLHVGSKDITDIGMGRLAELKHLKELWLRADSITDKGLAELKSLSRLERLDLSFCKKVTISGLSHLNALKNLSKLQLDFGVIQDNSALDISGLTQLQKLLLNINAPVYDKDLACLKNLTNLKYLVIGGATEGSAVTDAGIMYFKELDNLTELYCRSPYLTDNCLASLASMKQLRYVTVCGNFTDDGLRALEKAKSFRTLKILSTNKFSPAAIKSLRASLPDQALLTAEQEKRPK